MPFQYLKRFIRRTRLPIGLVFLLALLWFPGSAIGTDGFAQLLRADLKKRIEQQLFQKGLVCQGEFICGTSLIPDLYIDRDYNPLWVNATGISAEANTLISSLEGADDDGLRNRDYHLPRIQELIQQLTFRQRHDSAEAIPMWTDLEILFSDAFLLFGSHLLGGRINPESLHPDWIIAENHADLVNILKVASSSEKFSAIFNQLRPPHRGYHGLRTLLREYRTIAANGGWPVLASGRSIRKNDQDPRISQLYERLSISGDLVGVNDKTESDIYDEDLEKAMIKFQARHGLNPDGIIGKKTIAALNIPVEDQIRKIELNLERWRWLPHDFGDRFILANTADFRLSVIEKGQTVFNARVVVGKPARKTPVFSSILSYLVINPYWSVPTSIAIKDILPKVRQDPAYLKKNQFRLFSGWKADARELQPESIDWDVLNMNYFPYHLRQDPGENECIGKIKIHVSQ